MAYGPSIVLQAGTDTIQETIDAVIGFLPHLLGAIVILTIGWILGRVLAGVVRRVVDQSSIDRLVMQTPLSGALGETEASISRSLGRVAGFFVYALAILAAADALAIELLSEWIASAVSYLPAFVAGALIIVLGFVLADFLADIVQHTQPITETSYTDAFADGLRIFLYFVVTVMGLGTMGVDVRILNTFAEAAAWGLAAGVALAFGIAVGLGGRDYVAANVGQWLPGDAPAGEPAPVTQTDGGEETTD